jgi:hypothetical protein
VMQLSYISGGGVTNLIRPPILTGSKLSCMTQEGLGQDGLGRAADIPPPTAGAPRVVFVDREIRPSILHPAQPSSWRGTVFRDSRSFASIAHSAPMSSFGRGGQGGP